MHDRAWAWTRSSLAETRGENSPRDEPLDTFSKRRWLLVRRVSMRGIIDWKRNANGLCLMDRWFARFLSPVIGDFVSFMRTDWLVVVNDGRMVFLFFFFFSGNLTNFSGYWTDSFFATRCLIFRMYNYRISFQILEDKSGRIRSSFKLKLVLVITRDFIPWISEVFYFHDFRIASSVFFFSRSHPSRNKKRRKKSGNRYI